ncbi:hypothetical protein K3495_g7599 [Podosphaera aphanis]|nr:hypothetical protein K3495_g7599 [Podosphaera aphanis]
MEANVQKGNVPVNEMGLPIRAAGSNRDGVTLTTDTFGQWSLTVKSALLSADCFGAVKGTVAITDSNYSKITKDGLQILGNSVGFK